MSVEKQSPNLANAQLIQQRLKIREQEISALKTQNRHLLEKVDALEKSAEPNQVNTEEVAKDVQKFLEPVIGDMQTMMKSSFDILQSTMRGIYQQSQRAQQAVEDAGAHSRDLEIRMNEQRKADQNFYQDKIFSMIAAFCDRMERQIEIRLKALATVELLNAKQNEVLADVETMKGLITSMQKNTEASRNDTVRMDKNITEANEKLLDVQMQTQNTEGLVRDTLQQIENHRSEFKIIRYDVKTAVDSINEAVAQIEGNSIALNRAAHEINQVGNQNASFVSNAIDAGEVDENKIITDLISQKNSELESLEKNIEAHGNEGKDDVTMILSLLRAQKNELQKVAEEAKAYLQATPAAQAHAEVTAAATDANEVQAQDLEGPSAESHST